MTKTHIAAKVKLRSQIMQCVLANGSRSRPCKITLVQISIQPENIVADYNRKDAVAQEL